MRRTPEWRDFFTLCQGPAQVWCVDFEGQYRAGHREVVYPLTLEDAHSCHPEGVPGVEKHPRGRNMPEPGGIPRVLTASKIRSDNGPPCASVGLGGLSKLAVW